MTAALALASAAHAAGLRCLTEAATRGAILEVCLAWFRLREVDGAAAADAAPYVERFLSAARRGDRAAARGATHDLVMAMMPEPEDWRARADIA